MNFKTSLMILLAAATIGCATESFRNPDDAGYAQVPSSHAMAGSRPITIEAQQVVALEQERQQLLTTLGEFHERIRDLESKLADHDGKPVAKSYDELLAIKEAELSELRKASAEHETIVAQRDAATAALAQTKQQLEFLKQQAAKNEEELASIRGLKVTASELDTAKHRLLQLESLLQQRDGEMRELRGTASERANLAAQLQTITVTLNHTKERLAAAEKQLAQKDQDLRAQVHDRQRLSGESAAYATDLKQARQRITALEQAIAEKEEQLHQVKRTGSDRDKLAEQLSAVNMELTQAIQRVAYLDKELSAKTQELESLRTLASEPGRLADAVKLKPAPTGQQSIKQPGTPSGKQAGSAQIAAPRVGSTPPSQNLSNSDTAGTPNSKLAQSKEDLFRSLQQPIASGFVAIKQDGNQLRIALAEALLFPPGNVSLTPDGLAVLERVGHVIGQTTDRAVQVVGHTDNQQIGQNIRKTYPDNRALSWARADNARKALIAGGTSADHVRAIGMGDKQPVASNASETGRRQNRRLEIVVTQFSTTRGFTTGQSMKNGPNMAALSMLSRSGSR